MPGLFDGTAWERTIVCDRCGRALTECPCPPVTPPVATAREPKAQTARLRIEKRPRGKVVSVVDSLDDVGDHLDGLAALLKSRCGGGGTVKEGRVEIQGDHLATIRTVLSAIGYRVKG